MPVKAKYENLNLSTSPALSVPNVILYSSCFKKKKKLFNLTKKKKKQTKKYNFLSSQESSHVQLDSQKHTYIFTGLFLVFKALIAILFFSW